MLECVVNISEGRDAGALAVLAQACGPRLLDLHADPDHHRAVLTLAGDDEPVKAAVRDLARQAVALLDLGGTPAPIPGSGCWTSSPGWRSRAGRSGTPPPARRAPSGRTRRATSSRSGLQPSSALPVFLYGPERSLPEVRRQAWWALRPDAGPDAPHPTAGAVAVGWRGLMVAYNLWLRGADLAQARSIAAARPIARRPGTRFCPGRPRAGFMQPAGAGLGRAGAGTRPGRPAGGRRAL